MDFSGMQTGQNFSAEHVATPTTLAQTLASLTWGGSAYPAYAGRMEGEGDGAGAGAASSGSGSSAAAGAGTGTSASAGASPANGQGQGGSPTSGTGTGQGAGSDNDANLRTLRTNYERLKAWETVASKVKDPSEALTAHGTYSKMWTEAQQLAKDLGYTAESLREAFTEDPAETLQFLRGKVQANPEIANRRQAQEAMRRTAQEVMSPVLSELNNQKTEQAVQRFNTSLDQFLTDDKIGFGKSIDPDFKAHVVELIESMVPDSVLEEIKVEGKTAGLQKFVEELKAKIIKATNAYNKMTTSSGQSGEGQGNGQGALRRPAGQAQGAVDASKLTLDDIMNNPEKHLPGLRDGKYS